MNSRSFISSLLFIICRSSEFSTRIGYRKIRKIMPFYAVRAGKNPGIYETWAECQEQVRGFSKPVFKKFSEREDADQFIAGKLVQSPKKKGVCNFYAVRNGRVPGIYETWPECQDQITGWKRPVFKKFGSRKDALEFLGNTGASKRPFSTDSNTNDETVSKKAKLDSNDSSGKTTKFLDNLPDPPPNTERQSIGGYTGKTFSESDGVHVYTDGGCFNNGQNGARAGIGVYWNKDDPSNVSERLPGRPTNNRAEIHAAVKAVQQAKTKQISNLILHTDSQFLINGITKWILTWKRKDWKLSTGKPVINKEDFEELDKAVQGINIKWVYVKGHSGDASNDAVDLLAKAGAAKPLIKSLK